MRVLMLVTDGFDEISAFSTIGVLKRGGIDLIVAGLVSTVVEGSSDTRTIADKRLGEINTEKYEALILPAGRSYRQFLNSQIVMNLLREFDAKKKFICAIGESPVVLSRAGILEDKVSSVAAGLENQIPKPVNESVSMDKNIITAKSTTVSMEFALKVLEVFLGEKASEKVKKYLDEGNSDKYAQ